MPSPPQSTITIEAGGTTRTFTTKSRTSSGGSASIRSHPSNGSGGSGYSGGSGSTESESWSVLERDEIEPEDSASRARQPSSRRYTTEARPAPTRRHSSRRIREPEEEPPRRHRSTHRQHSSRSRRVDSHRAPSDDSSLGTVASYPDDYPQGHHGMPPPRGYPYPNGVRHVPAPGHGGYPPSIVTSGAGYPEGYNSRGAMVHLPQQDPFGYPVNGANPFGTQDPQSNPFSPMSAASGSTSYFAMDPHAPPMPHHHRPPAPQRPQSFVGPPSSYYGSDVMSPYGHPGMNPYPGYPMHPMAGMPGYPHMPWGYPPSNHSSPPPPAEPKKEEKDHSMEALQAMIQKHEEARIAWQNEMIAKEKADAAAAAAAKAKDEEEKKKMEEIADATKKAKEAAEKKAEEAAKKAKDEADKKFKELEEAKEEALKKQKELEAETEKLKPPDHTGKSIKFKDAVGRKFSFPFHLCKTWKGMRTLIEQAFVQIDVIGDHVRQGHYDLQGPDGEIILPQVWENMIQPDWEIEMHLWPFEEEKKGKGKDKGVEEVLDPLSSLGLGDLGDLGILDPGTKKKSKKDGTKKKTKNGDANIMIIDPMIPPPGVLPDPLSMAFGGSAGVEIVKDKPSKAKGKKANNGGLAAWFAGSSAPPRSKKDDEKLQLVRHRSGTSNGSSVRSASIRSHSTTNTTSKAAKRNSERVGGCAVM